MRWKALEERFKTRALTEEDDAAVLALYRSNPLYYRYCPPEPGPESVKSDRESLPPGVPAEKKHFRGIFAACDAGETLAAVLDLVEDYPAQGCAYIGLLMVDASLQGKGMGSGIIDALLRDLSASGFGEVRLAWMKGNPQAEGFWRKNGFVPTGREVPHGSGTAVIAVRRASDPVEIRPVRIRPVRPEDEAFWYTLDRHLPREEFAAKVRDGRGYVLLENGEKKGILRYGLFWDNTPFLNLVFLEEGARRRGLGRRLLAHWEREMAELGFSLVMTSTQSDEEAQHFYRKLGYTDCGAFVLPIPGFEQPAELIFAKKIR